MKTIAIALSWFFACQIHAASAEEWITAAPRDEIRPQFQSEKTGGKSGRGALVIRADEREGLHGWWQKTVSVSGGQHYLFSAWYRAENVSVPRRSVLARVVWHDEIGGAIQRREGVLTNYAKNAAAMAEPEYPRHIIEKSAGNGGWIEVSGVYAAPSGATRARVELHLLWAPNSKVQWSDVSFLPSEAPAPRKVRLASVHTGHDLRRPRWASAVNLRRSSKTLPAAKPTWSCWGKP